MHRETRGDHNGRVGRGAREAGIALVMAIAMSILIMLLAAGALITGVGLREWQAGRAAALRRVSLAQAAVQIAMEDIRSTGDGAIGASGVFDSREGPFRPEDNIRYTVTKHVDGTYTIIADVGDD